MIRALAVDSSTTISAASVQVLAADTFRGMLLIHNPGTTSIAVNLTGAAAALNTAGSITLSSGGTLLLDQAVTTSAITAIASTAAPITVNIITNVSAT